MLLDDEQIKLLRYPEIFQFINNQIHGASHFLVLNLAEMKTLEEFLNADANKMSTLINTCINDAWQYNFVPELNNTYASEQKERLLMKYIYYSCVRKKVLAQENFAMKKLADTENTMTSLLDIVARLDLQKKWS